MEGAPEEEFPDYIALIKMSNSTFFLLNQDSSVLNGSLS